MDAVVGSDLYNIKEENMTLAPIFPFLFLSLVVN